MVASAMYVSVSFAHRNPFDLLNAVLSTRVMHALYILLRWGFVTGKAGRSGASGGQVHLLGFSDSGSLVGLIGKAGAAFSAAFGVSV